MATTKRNDVKDLGLAQRACGGSSGRTAMPVLAAIRERFEREQPLAATASRRACT